MLILIFVRAVLGIFVLNVGYVVAQVLILTIGQFFDNYFSKKKTIQILNNTFHAVSKQIEI